MKRALSVLLALFVALNLQGAPKEEKSNTKPDAGGVVIEPSEGEIAVGAEITITFPNAMVGTDKIDMSGQSCPFVSQPPVEGDFLWKSQTEGVFTVKAVVAGAKHRLTLVRDLKDANGKRVDAPGWSAEFEAAAFAITSASGERDELEAQPQIALNANYDVRLSDVAEHVYFQDRDSGARFPVDVILRTDEKPSPQPEAQDFSVAPRAPLPMGRTYDLIVNGLVESKSRRALPYLKVFPAGKTVPMKTEWVVAYNTPFEEPTIEIRFTDDVDPAEITAGRIQIEPAVPEMQLLTSGNTVTVKGKFDMSQRHRVTISPEIKGERGYGLAEPSRWGATFHPQDPTIFFPASQIFLRARPELRFTFFQVNTPAVTWKLARVPLEKLPAVNARVRDFERNAVDPVTGKEIVDPRTGFKKQFQTELLVDAFNLPVVASGTTEAASGDGKKQRDIRGPSPNGQPLSGAFLIEASAALADGRIVGNRSIVCASDFVLTQKRTSTKAIVRVTKMSDGQGVAGVTVRAISNESIELARATTDGQGMATFDREKVFVGGGAGAHFFIADAPNGPAIQFAEGTSYPSGERGGVTAKPHVEIITDRNLYRPGHVVKMKGIARNVSNGALTIPDKAEVHWQVTESYGTRALGEGTATLSSYGGWESEWTVPEKAKLGRYDIKCKIDNKDYDGSVSISLEEYRVPLFSVVVEANAEVGQTAQAHVASAYFHGAPNAGARVHWKATFTPTAEVGSEEETHEYKRRYNSFAEIGPRLDPSSEETKTIEGDAKLDGHGFVDLACESPYKDNAAIGRTNVIWRAEITSLDGQTLAGGDMAALFSAATRLGVHADGKPGKPGGVEVSIDAIDEDDAKVEGVAVHVDLFHVTTKVAKEQLGPFIYRYRNTDQFAKVASREVKTPAEFIFPASETGRYVVAVGAAKTPLVSDETMVAGEEPAELPVQNETSFKIEHRPEPFTPGEKAVFTIQAPFGGLAWVSIETDEILDTLLVPLSGNAGRIELPVKKEYAPNATVSIYLVKPGGKDEMPRERFAASEIEVRRPDRELKIEPRLENVSVKPGETVSGEVRVTSEGKAVDDVDLVVFAVDDAVLKLGDWKLPDVLENFYRRSPHAVRSYQSLANYLEDIKLPSLTQKGFIIGGGEEETTPNVQNVRKEFKTLAFWQGSLTTDKDGKAEFNFTAPDNLTTYRLVAVGQTKANQFGGDASATVKVSKPLLINAALPRFLRDGDEVELRMVVQQNFADSQEITARCVTDASCKLLGSDQAEQTAARDAPTVFRFKAQVHDVDLAPVKIRFEAAAKSDAKMADAIELTLPVQPPTIVRKESVAGPFAGPEFDAKAKMPNDWKRGRGGLAVTVSTSPWLPKIAGLPVILEYPHGCFEQISTKLLGYSFLANLLAYLPDAAARDAEYRQVLERGMKQFNDSLLEDGALPYWPGGTTANTFVTCQAFWAINESVNAGFQAPEGLRDKLAGALKKILNGQMATGAFEKCYALFVLTQYEKEGDFKTASHDLYLRRNDAGDEGRALLAIALQRQDIMPKEKEQLLKELDAPIKERAFDPKTLGSATRAEAITALAFDTIAPKIYTPPKKQRVRDRMLALMDSSASLSTQENLWLLLEFKSMIGAEKAEAISNTVDPKGVSSKNGRAVAWLDRKIEPPSQGSGVPGNQLLVKGLNKTALTFLMQAEYSTPEPDTDRVDRGFRVERVVKNLSDAKRTGEASAPFKLGDQLLITYRMQTRKLQNYVALEDALPAGLEVVNPNLAMIGKFFEMPPTAPTDHELDLSHSEMRDKATLLYFDTFAPGSGVYSVLARATAAGTFRWPATQVVPMYDSRFSGLSPSSICVISGE